MLFPSSLGGGNDEGRTPRGQEANWQYSNIDAQLDVFDTLDLDMGTFTAQEGLYF